MGSLRKHHDPWLTLEHYHSKYSAAEGEPTNNLRAYTRYANPELDALLDTMETMVPSPNDPAYMDLVSQALAIYLRDLPDITLAEELQVIPFNTTYWTGWPSAADPYSHGFPVGRLRPRDSSAAACAVEPAPIDPIGDQGRTQRVSGLLLRSRLRGRRRALRVR
ncbi:MAG: hypothetical protein HND48_01405 [Chloroflexi bacterium]|nr:hypothetical protein [Chloroflexota bacterium]